ncbi:MAG: hypothetical protein V7749_00800 [Cocleimonas sp.]
MRWLKRILGCDDESRSEVMQSTIQKGYELFKDDELERYCIAIKRIEAQFGVNNCGLTQFAWAVLATRDYRTDPECDDIPG